jgi:hypothetical protein
VSRSSEDRGYGEAAEVSLDGEELRTRLGRDAS